MEPTHPSNERGRIPAPPAGFTLVELLTVIAIIAILATLLMTTFSSVKRQAREAVCTSNLRQIGIALELYLDDFRKRPADLVMLAGTNHLGDGRILSCPADRLDGTALMASTPVMDGGEAPQASNASPSPHVSYQHPLAWSDEEWNRLMQAGTRAGVVVCTWHDIRAGLRGTTPGVATPQGLILRGHLDGTVVRRHVVSSTLMAQTEDTKGMAAGFAPPPGTDNSTTNSSWPPWDFFSDDPPP